MIGFVHEDGLADDQFDLEGGFILLLGQLQDERTMPASAGGKAFMLSAALTGRAARAKRRVDREDSFSHGVSFGRMLGNGRRFGTRWG